MVASLWPRQLDERRFPVRARLYRPEPEVQVLIHVQRPEQPRGEVILVHGLEGSSDSHYMRSLAQALLEAGFQCHRFNQRGCGGTEFLSNTLYHAGLTSDLFAFLTELDRQRRTPVFLVGFSLGGNTVLKLAGEMGDDGYRLIAGVCAVSTPLELAACTRRLQEPQNWLYERMFVRSMKRRLRLRHKVMPERFPIDGLGRVRTVFDFDDRITAPAFAFRGAEHYYDTQSCARFLDAIGVPALLIQAQDDPMIPFEVYDHPAFRRNRNLRLLSVEHGGHVGFVSRGRPRFWADHRIVEWILDERNKSAPPGVG